MKTWFTSDLHFFHRNIVKFTNRGAETNEDSHNEWLVDLWNSTVSRSDIVYHLGDLSFAKDVRKTLGILDRLNGNIHLIKGNHDHSDNFKKIAQHNRVTTHIYLERKFEEQESIMFHFPIGSWHKQHRGSWHLHGHSHGGYQEGKGKILDVGIDNAYNLYGKHKFFDWEMIKEYMQNREEYIADEHRSNL